MKLDPAVPTMAPVATGPKYALIPVHGAFDIVAATVLLMLDNGNSGQVARAANPGEQIPFGFQPVLVAPATVYATVGVEYLLQAWPREFPRPWLVLVSDVPAAPAPAARFRLRALENRLAGVARVPYLPVLRYVEGPAEAVRHKDVQRAAAKLRRRLEGK